MLLDMMHVEARLSTGHHRELLRALRHLNGRLEVWSRTDVQLREFARWEPSDTTHLQGRLSKLNEPGEWLLQVVGSPAYVTGNGDAVFGSGAARRLSVAGCMNAMLGDWRSHGGADGTGSLLDLVEPELWLVAKVDATRNLDCGSKEAADELVERLKRVPRSGRMPITRQHSVYWTPQSDRFSPKAYGKGQRLRVQNAKYGLGYTEAQLAYADRLVRCELQVKRAECLRLGPEFPPEKLMAAHEEVFRPLLDATSGDLEYDDVVARLRAELKPREASKAVDMYRLIVGEGWERAKRRTLENYSVATWNRNVKRLRDAGITGLEQCQGNGATDYRLPEKLRSRPRPKWVDDWPDSGPSATSSTD